MTLDDCVTREDYAHAAGVLSARVEHLEWALECERNASRSLNARLRAALEELASARRRADALEELARGPAPRPSVRPGG